MHLDQLVASMFQLHIESNWNKEWSALIKYRDARKKIKKNEWITGAIESLIAVLINLLNTLERATGNDVLPNKHRNTAFLVTSGPGLEKNSVNTNTSWNSWNTLSPIFSDFLESDFFSKNTHSATNSKQRSWFFLLVHWLSVKLMKIWNIQIETSYRIYSPIRAKASLADWGKSHFFPFLWSDELICRYFGIYS